MASLQYSRLRFLAMLKIDWVEWDPYCALNDQPGNLLRLFWAPILIFTGIVLLLLLSKLYKITRTRYGVDNSSMVKIYKDCLVNVFA